METIPMTCPACGRTYLISTPKPTRYYLDGVPKDVNAALARLSICTCGCVITEHMKPWPELHDLLTSEVYLKVLNGNYTEQERKIRLMMFYPLVYIHADAWLLHVTHNKKDVLSAIKRAQNLPHEFKPLEFSIILPPNSLEPFHWNRSFCLTNRLHIADLQRQAGLFQEAQITLETEAREHPNVPRVQEYIAYERKLITERNTQEI